LVFKLNETDKFLDAKDKIKNSKEASKVQERYKLEAKIDVNIEEIKKKYGEIQTSLESQKKNKKKVNKLF